ncbi:class I SAM-dependent methyltransferase [Vitreoscilla stercoraria]|uniref:Class I SAM-dependent methyltransferase n=1 Tax=Vitreoscilla stercoraria TaxID=61 RepID=A0ABY4EEP8_VITST|nr:class I SAM-dependent methyltransferase [Vitreoscilla stercoraria]UOO93664.1 class I SAM-dependent methyltransferase [Vitreoscilla stercoraria]
MTTDDYYNQHANEFISTTFAVEMERLYEPFLTNLSENARILDVGCGSGRDTLAFKRLGYQVEAIDSSEELVKHASALTGIKVRHQSFYDLEEDAVYDGIWACASLLHCERPRLFEVVLKLIQALKPNGVLYMSFKYGNQDREHNGRMFTDLNETQAEALLQQYPDIALLQQWLSIDQRPERSEKWLNLLWKKHG